MERGGYRGRGSGGYGRGRGGRRSDQPHHDQQVGRGSRQGRNPAYVGASQNSQQGRGGNGGRGAWRSGETFANVLTRGSSPPPEQGCGAIVPQLRELQISEPSSPSSSSLTIDRDRLLPMTRPDRGGTHAIREVDLRVNHFPVTFDPNKVIRQYNVCAKLEASASDGKLTKVSKSYLSMIRSQLSSDNPNSFPIKMTAYDGEKNIFSAVRLPTGEFVVKLLETSYLVPIKLVNELKLRQLMDYLCGNDLRVPRDILQGMDVVMKENPRRSMIIPYNHTSHLAELHTTVDIGRGVMASREPKHRLKATSGHLALCLDYSVLPFHKPMPVIDYLKELIDNFDVNEFGRYKNQAETILSGLKVCKEHLDTKRINLIYGLTEENARHISFTIKDQDANVPPRSVYLVDYFKEKYGRDIMYKDIPCLDLGNNNFVPMELCFLAERQRYPKDHMDKMAQKNLKRLSLAPPKVREETICSMVRATDGPCGGDIARNFGIEVDTNMTKATGRVIKPPALQVGAGGGRLSRIRLHAEKCDWNLYKKCVVEGKEIQRWAVLDFSSSNGRTVKNRPFISKLIARCNELGIHMEKPLLYESTSMYKLSRVATVMELVSSIERRAREMGKGQLQFLLCVLVSQHHGYKYLKWITETKIGIVTQCCLLYGVNKADDQFLGNLALKINAKLRGRNVQLIDPLPRFEGKGHVMFLGADVNHPAPKNSESPSIAAVVASVNWPDPQRYAAKICPQDHRTENIKEFTEMCLELVEYYVRQNKVKPDKIVIFRDGVSDSQFDMVLNEELAGLRRAFRAMNYFPSISLVVAQKRHMTRFFPETKKDGCSTGNMPPGTVVDTTVDDRSGFNFYLCSHYGSIGTSKPTHYQVLWDEHNFTSDQMQQLIYSMCFTCARCTKPVSLIPPVYYADLAAYRGRLYQEALRDWQQQTPASSKSPEVAFDKNFYKVHPNLEDTMFFI